ncbi:MAG: sulfate ABC transporter permease subunit CysT [Thermoguttaceae bacterium]|jgi:sulfate transport system permease protein
MRNCKIKFVEHSILPGFNITMGFTVAYLSLIVLIPLAGLFVVSAGVSFDRAIEILSNTLVKRAFTLTFSTAFIAACVNGFFGLVIAWTLVRYRFPGRRILDAMIDLPFALPTAVSGIVLARLYSENGWVGQFLPFGVRNTEIGVTIALIFIGMPFVIRTLQPALKELDQEVEEAAASLGASRWQTFRRVIFPSVLPAHISGFAMAFARALGEYGTVIFIGGVIPGKTQTLSTVIFEKAEENNLEAAAVIALVTLILSFLMLVLINAVQVWSNRRTMTV